MAKSKVNGWSLALLRVVLGIIMFYHGYVKLFAPGGFKGTIAYFSMIGIPAATYAALIVSFAEFFGGLFLIFGLLTKWSSTVLLIEMVVAFFKAHMGNGLFVSKGGYEYVLLIIAGLVIILANGAGKLALGNMLKNKQLH